MKGVGLITLISCLLIKHFTKNIVFVITIITSVMSNGTLKNINC